MQTTATDIRLLIEGMHPRPHDLLGMKTLPDATHLVRSWRPLARTVEVIAGGARHISECTDKEGLFECRLPAVPAQGEVPAAGQDVPPYMLSIDGGEPVADPYSLPFILSDYDLHLMGEGTHYGKYEKLGAHPTVNRGISGTHFALWAPNARGISVVGEFNGWDGRYHQLSMRGTSGIWEIFVPGVSECALYKYEIRSENFLTTKADPYAFYSEIRPYTASVVWDLNRYDWNDQGWMHRRRETDWLEKPIAIYEVHPGSWDRVAEEGNRFLTYREMAEELVSYVAEMGYTHIELMPVSEHPLDESWGYQTVGYFSVTSRFGTPEDFMYFVDRCHQEDIGVIIDWVPAHFPKDAHGLAYFDGTFLYEHSDPRQREHMDWGTHIFNYGRNEVKNYLLTNALFWLHKYHIDGLRVDAVASMLYLNYSREEGQWIPNRYGGNENLEAIEFVKQFNELCHRHYPGVLTIAEESTSWPMVSRPTYLGGLGFSLKWNMGWMHDTLDYFEKDPVYRSYHHGNLTFAMLYAFHENFVLVLSHDEVVHGKRALLDKMPGDLWQKFANLRLLHALMYAQPGKKMLFMGGELGQWSEWTSSRALDWDLLVYEPHRRLQFFVSDLNRLYRNEPALWQVDFDWQGFEWIDFSDQNNCIISFIRRAKDPADYLVVVFNFTPVLRENYRIGVPEQRVYQEIFNTDAEAFWGSNAGNGGWAVAERIPASGRPASLNLTIPPLGALFLKPR